MSTIDANLALQGTMAAPVLSGNVLVRDAFWSRRIEATPDFFNLAGGSGGSTPAVGAAASAFPLRLDIDIDAPSSLRMENNIAKMVASADLKLQGTYDRPQLFGHVEIDRGDIVLEGNRYIVTRGGIDFFNAARIEPVFDIEAETRVRVPDQTYNITLGLSRDHQPFLLHAELRSAAAGSGRVLAAPRAGHRPDQRGAAGAPAERGAAVGGSAAAAGVLAPADQPDLGAGQPDPRRDAGHRDGDRADVRHRERSADALGPPDPGRRLSNRAYITFARALGGTQREQIIILEYDQNDRLGWVVTQNGDRTFALDFRVRHRF